jgi:23S rRNA pseudouridine1911/1915/1917 synthase
MRTDPAATGLDAGGPDGAAITVRVGETDAGQRLDRVLAIHFRELSRTRLKQLIETGHVTLDGSALCDPSRRVRPNQNFVVIIPHIKEAELAGQPIWLDIRFEDAHLIVIDKPAGMVVHPAPGNPDSTLVNALLDHCGPGLSGIGGVRRPGIVHRLDKDTSGLMVVAKTELAHHALSRDFATRRIDRAYAAFVWGVPAPSAGEIAGNIGRSPVNRKKMAAVADGRGKTAVTRYRVERNFGDRAALVECRLATGRTHQIRVHLAHLGHPLIGDPLYGGHGGREVGRQVARLRRQALHARRLGFTHPVEHRLLAFDSRLPADLEELARSLERL